MEPTRVEELDDTGEWQPLHGITNVVIFEKLDALRETADRIREMHDAVITFMHAYAKAARPLLEEAGRASQTMHDAGLAARDGKPVRRPDRPAWQSPYGPPARRS
ncbi:hypothetical protein AB0I84_13200 [Streptomyces spectabilis]|uniref:hypothetical protein n=1 Tax=Streptomyces spectabilis TaxID=68270 RepID=UPI0033DA7936